MILVQLKHSYDNHNMLHFLSILIFLTTQINSQTNNVCPTYQDYYTIKNNSKCRYDFAAELNLTETIKRYGYPLETHKVTTTDGYILSVFRIPPVRNLTGTKIPVFLQHGMSGSSAIFIGLGKNSLVDFFQAFVLSDGGYDVWLGNFRGTRFSEGHVNLTVYDKSYWDHGLDEIDLLDIPTQLQLVSNKTGNKGNILYIGHSLGTTAAMIYSSTHPNEVKSMIKFFIFLAPVATLPNINSPLKFFVPFADYLLNLAYENDLIRILSHSASQQTLYRLFCLESPVMMQNCLNLLNTFYGLRTQQPPESVPVYFNQVPGGTSVRVIRHASDLILNRFGKYNYGVIENLRRYGSAVPPSYDVSKISIPVYMMYAINDWICNKDNSYNFYNRLKPSVRAGVYEINETNFNHIDFLYGRNARSLVYQKLLQVLKEYS